MIVGDPNSEIFLIIEKILFECMDNNTHSNGIFNFVIKDDFYPGRFYAADLFNSIRILKNRVNYFYGNKNVMDIKDLSLSQFDFGSIYGVGSSSQECSGIDSGLIDRCFCEVTDVIEMSSVMRSSIMLGFYGGSEVVVFTRDLFETFDKIILPKGYFLNLVNSIPDVDKIDVCSPADNVFQTVFLN